MDDARLFDLDAVPEVPLFREPHRSRGAAIMDERLDRDYPPEWRRCQHCMGRGKTATLPCPTCDGMGSVKAMVRLRAGHRCERCRHPYVPKSDARRLDVAPSGGGWSACDDQCVHLGPVRMREAYRPDDHEWRYFDLDQVGGAPADFIHDYGPGGEVIRRWDVEAEWRVLTVHHLDGDNANLAWWNLAALCQRCHLEIQAKVVMEQVYPHEHSDWFKPHAAGYYAKAYLGLDLDRAETLARMDELLALEVTPA